MGENRRNSIPGIIVFLLMFILFSFIHEEKERQITRTTAHSIVITDVSNPGQAIISPAISVPGINLLRAGILNVKFAYLDCTSGREFVFNNLVSNSFTTSQVKIHFINPVISIFFLQKVPEQEKEDDLLSIA